MSTQNTPDARADQNIAAGDKNFGEQKFDTAKTSYEAALKELGTAYGYMSEKLVPVLEKLAETLYNKGAQNSSDTRKEICKYLKMVLAIKQRVHGVRSAELISTLEKLVVFYDFDGAHMLAIEVLQRIDDINANLTAGQSD